jgi:pyruvate dehydrogenase E2 component (dihydrolipoamide acetyltransferase)
MPHLSQTTEEVHLIRWLVQEGQKIERGDSLCEVESDKTTMEVESFTSGTVLELIGEPDTDIPVGTVIAVVGDKGELDANRVLATPMVRNIARKRGVDITQVQGTGPQGLITKQDLEQYIASRYESRYESQDESGTPENQGTRPDSKAPLSRQQPDKDQQIVASRMQASKATIPHFYLKTSIIMDPLLQWREANRDKKGKQRSMTACLLAACSRALTEYPRCNSWYREDEIIPHEEQHIGFAVDAGGTLFVPVIQSAGTKDIATIDREVRSLTEKARGGELSGSDQRDGTFTLSNLGMYTVDEFSAIINPPQVSIVAFAQTQKRFLVAEDESMAVHSVCTISGSFDHRVVNGAEAAAFLSRLKEIIEEELFT